MQSNSKQGWRRIIVALILYVSCAGMNASAQDTPLPKQKPAALGAEPSKDAGLFNFSEIFNDFKKPQHKPPHKALQKKQHKGKKADAQTHIPIPQTKPTKRQVTQSRGAVKLSKTKPDDGKLSSRDIETYKKIFTLQDTQDIKAAKVLGRNLGDGRLMGHVLYDRYMHPSAYSSSFSELQTWLKYYSDHPGATDIYKLAMQKANQAQRATLKKPQTRAEIVRRNEPTMSHSVSYVSHIERSSSASQGLAALTKKVKSQIRDGQPDMALETLTKSTSAQYYDTVEYDLLLANIAASFMYHADLHKAAVLSRKAAKRSGLHVPLATWVAGITTWKSGQYGAAARYFESVARSSYASGWTKSAGAYWASRAHMKTGNVAQVSIWLRRAADHPRTFYGLIATRALGEDFDFNWELPKFTKQHYKILAATSQGFRALALVDANRHSAAQRELLTMDISDPRIENALLAYAGHAQLPALSMRLGVHIKNDINNSYYDAALYPQMPWKTNKSTHINPALVHAIIRQESRFNPKSQSGSGAKGLMQIMPATARAMAGHDNPALDNPSVNLRLGEKYLKTLLDMERVDSDMLSLLIAYNAGPGNLGKWKRRWSEVSDPLLFIELLPSAETRAYVERVLSNYWIYRMRAGRSIVSLDNVVSGDKVEYVDPIDDKPLRTARAN